MALYFPNIEGTSLATSKKIHTTNLFKDKVSLVSMASFKSSEVSFVFPFYSYLPHSETDYELNE